MKQIGIDVSDITFVKQIGSHITIFFYGSKEWTQIDCKTVEKANKLFNALYSKRNAWREDKTKEWVFIDIEKL